MGIATGAALSGAAAVTAAFGDLGGITTPTAPPSPGTAPSPPRAAPGLPGAEMTCPRCGTLQPRAEACASCGIIIAKVLARQAQAEAARGAAEGLLERTFENVGGLAIKEYAGIERIGAALESGLSSLALGERYDVRDQDGRFLLKAEKGRLGGGMKGLLRAVRSIEARDNRDTLVFSMRYGFRAFKSAVEVLDATDRPLGNIETEFSLVARKLTITHPAGRTLFELEGPLLKPWTFRVERRGRPWGTIRKQWTGLFSHESFHGTDLFGAEFPADADATSKSLVLAATLLIDGLYFDQKD